MKKRLIVFLAVVLCVTLAFTLVACGDKDKGGDENNGGSGGGNSEGGGVSATAYEGGGTVSAAVTLTAADLDDPEMAEYFVSGTTQVITGATATDVTNYRNKLVQGGWTLVDTGASATAASASSEYYIYYKGDTVISVVFAGNELTIITVNYTAGTIANVLLQDDEDDEGDEEEYTPVGTKYTSWPSSQILSRIGTALPEWTAASEYYYFETTTPAITATVTFKGTATNAMIYQTRLTGTGYDFLQVAPGAYSKTVDGKTIGVGVVEDNGYVSVSATVVTGAQAPELSEVQSRIAESYPDFTFSAASSITVSGGYVELNNDAFSITLTSSDLNALMTSIVSDFDDVVGEFGYTKDGATTVTYSKNSIDYIEISNDGDGIEISLLVLPEAKSVWPTAAIAAYVGVGNLPAYVAEGDNAGYSAWTGHASTGYTITVSGTTQSEYDTYVTSLTTAGYSYNDENDQYYKAFTDNTVIVKVKFAEVTSQTIFSVSVISSSGDLNAWPTARLASDIADFTLPAVSGATSFSYDDSLWIGGSGFILLKAFGVSEAELNTYLTTTLSAAERVDINTLRLLSDDTQLVIEYSYDESIDCLAMELSVEPYDAPQYTRIPANLKMVYTNEDNVECAFYRVGNDWCYTVTDYPGASYATTDYYYWKYDDATSQWTRYEYKVINDVAWTPILDLDEVVTTANLDDKIGSWYWGKLLKTADAKFLAGTSGEETIAGILCDTYTYTDEDSYTYFIAIAQESGLCMKYTERFMGTMQENFVVTAFETSGVTMPEDDFPVAIDAEVVWPTAKINSDIGENVPAYTGNATMINYNNSRSAAGIFEISINGVSVEEFNDYIALFETAGYTEESSSEDYYTFEKVVGAKTYTVSIDYYAGETDYDGDMDVEVTVR